MNMCIICGIYTWKDGRGTHTYEHFYNILILFWGVFYLFSPCILRVFLIEPELTIPLDSLTRRLQTSVGHSSGYTSVSIRGIRLPIQFMTCAGSVNSRLHVCMTGMTD